jgi:hypothetical protein
MSSKATNPNNPINTCIHCGNKWTSNSPSRIANHLRKCTKIPERLWERFQPSRLGNHQKRALEVAPQDLPRGEMTSKRPKRNGIEGFVDTCSDSEQVALDETLAEWIYGSGLPLHTVDSPLFRAFIYKLRPAYRPLSRKVLSTSMLDATYNKYKSRMDNVIERYQGELSLNTDGWTNPRGDSIINYILVARDEALFVKSVSTGKDRHTGMYIADGLKETIEELGPQNICAVTTDNASNMKFSWDEVQDKYPLIDCIGCGAHMTNLLVEDIMEIPAIHEAFNTVKEVNKYWKESTVRWGLLQYTAEKDGKKAKALQLPGKTRWQGKLLTCKSSLDNKRWMEQAIVIKEACLGNSPTLDQAVKYDYTAMYIGRRHRSCMRRHQKCMGN